MMDDPDPADQPTRHDAVNRRPERVKTRPLVFLAVPALLMAGLLGIWLDAPAARFAATLPRGQVQVWNVITDFGTSGYMFAASAIVAAASIAWRRRASDPTLKALLTCAAARSAFFFACIAISGIAAQTIKHIVGRMRPRYVAVDGAFDFVGPSWVKGADSFPSGHTTSAFAAAVALGLFLPRLRIPLLAAAALIGLSRIATSSHFPSDVFAGAALGCGVTLAVSVWLGRRRDIAGFQIRDLHLQVDR